MTTPSLPRGVVRIRADLAPPTPKERAEAEKDRHYVVPAPATVGVGTLIAREFTPEELEAKRLAQFGFQADGSFMVDANRLRSVEDALREIFAAAGVERLGGASGTLGWSSFATFERCPYLWKRLYKDGLKNTLPAAPALEIGTLVHVFLALHFMLQIDRKYPLTPHVLYNLLLDSGCSIQHVMQAYEYFVGYVNYYDQDCLIPLAVEHLAVDPETSESCRYDLIARVDDVTRSRLPIVPGTYIVEHKTSAKFDGDTLDGWRNDGEILGQIMFWKRLNLDAVFGPLRGVMMNIVGKQKRQQFHRTVVVPSERQSEQHGRDLRQWHGFRQLMTALDQFPRSRGNCIGRWGKCALYDHCSGDDGSRGET